MPPGMKQTIDAARRYRRHTLALWCAILAPLAWLPGGFSRFVFAKLLVLAVAAVLAATVARPDRLPTRLWLWVAAGGLIFVLAAIAGGTPVASLLGRWPRYEGLPVLATYAAAAWLGAALAGPTSRRLRDLRNALATLGVVLAVAAALELMGWSPLGPSSLDRTGSLLGNATDQGMVGLMVAATLAPSVGKRRPWWTAGALAGVVVVILSGSRASLLALLVVGLALALLQRRALARTLLPALGAVTLLALTVPAMRDRLASLQTVE
ncbi:MAG: hypothetical protein WAW88_16170, partial [Nocardioides sp.]